MDNSILQTVVTTLISGVFGIVLWVLRRYVENIGKQVELFNDEVENIRRELVNYSLSLNNLTNKLDGVVSSVEKLTHTFVEYITESERGPAKYKAKAALARPKGN